MTRPLLQQKNPKIQKKKKKKKKDQHTWGNQKEVSTSPQASPTKNAHTTL